MKNNRITMAQFWYAMMLSGLIAILFVDNKNSIFFIIECAAALTVDILIITFYKGKSDVVTKVITGIYFTLFAIITGIEFLEYMSSTLDYNPPWLIAMIMMGFAYFCTIKGIEAISRAAAVIGVFTFFALVYILICCFDDIKLGITLEPDSNILPALTLLFPSAAYVALGDCVTKQKARLSVIFSGVILMFMLCFSFLSFEQKGSFPVHIIPAKAHLGVFRGADFMLLSFLSVSSLYIISLGSVSMFSSVKHIYITNAVYIFVVFGLTVAALYAEPVRNFLISQEIVMIFSVSSIGTMLFYSIIKKLIKKPDPS